MTATLTLSIVSPPMRTICSNIIQNNLFHVKYFTRIFLDNIFMSKFAARLAETRKEAGLSRKQLAEKCGTIERNFSYWELGQRECDFDMLVKLANALDVSIDYLLGRTDF